MKKKVLITGVTGTMGFATLKQFAAHLDEFDVRVLARKSDFNENMFPRGVESKVEQYLKYILSAPRSSSQFTAASDSATASSGAMERLFSATTTAS